MHLLPTIAALLLALGAVEGLAYWWMHPTPAGQGEPVLAYRPQVNAEMLKTESRGARWTGAIRDVPGTGTAGGRDQMLKEEAQAPAQRSPSISASENLPPAMPVRAAPGSSVASAPTAFSVSASTLTPLPEIYDKAAPMLRCSSGQVFLAKPADSLSLHLAYFEWDGTDTGSVLEAFRHMPEACMGSIGMTLVSKEKPIAYAVGLDRRASPLVANGAKSERTSNSSSSSHSLIFDHTIFRDPNHSAAPLSPPVHAFRAVWVSGLSGADARQGLDGNQFDRLRTIRLKSAISRFKPAHARVIQGAVRGAANGNAAWKAFEQTMLADLTFER